MLTSVQEGWRVPPRSPASSRECVRTWFVALDPAGYVPSRLEAVLSSDERERAARFHFERDRRRFIVARAVLRMILAEDLGMHPSDVPFRHGRFGKPYLAPPVDACGLFFNVAHSHGAALIAAARGREVGIDLERIRPVDDLRGVAEHAFSEAERTAIRSLPEDGRLRGFFDCWTRKEAFVKAIGEGMSHPMDGFDVSVSPGSGPKELRVPGADSGRSRWTLTALEPHPDYAAAIVVEGRNASFDCREISVSGKA